MKRKWLWGLSALPLVIEFVFAKRLADKRPQLVARDIDISGVTISPDGKRIVARGNWNTKSQIIRLSDGSRISILGDINSKFFFSPDGTKLYQMNSELEDRKAEKFRMVLVSRDANSGRVEGQFRFESGAQLYGAAWRDGEVIAESAHQIWHFDARNLRLLSTQKRHRAEIYAILCPDGKTFYWQSGSDEMGNAYIWTFSDLRTGQILWKDDPHVGGGSPMGFSVDGHIVLRSGGYKNQGEVIACDTRTGVEHWRFRGPIHDDLALSPDQSAIYEARANGELWKWPR